MKAQLSSDLTMEYTDAGRGLPVVLLHAFPLSRAMWRPQIEALQAQWRIFAPDLRGFGGTSDFDGPPSIPQIADDVAAWLDHLDIREPIVLGGLSMGGYVALAFVRKYPARLRALILADTKAEADDAAGKANRDKMIAFAESHTAREVIDSVMPKMATSPAAVEQVRALASTQSTAGIANAVRAMRDRPDSSDVLPLSKMPTLVIVGSEDQLTPLPVAQSLAGRIAGAKLEVIERAGHISNLENPTAFNDALKTFLTSVR
jgi:pimeloyl-ACP methyl ester carboxylesterase